VRTDEDRIIQLLKERGWFNIALVYNNKRRAILAFEKGTPGQRGFPDAFKALARHEDPKSEALITVTYRAPMIFWTGIGSLPNVLIACRWTPLS